MNALGKAFRKKNDPKIEKKNVKIKMELPPFLSNLLKKSD